MSLLFVFKFGSPNIRAISFSRGFHRTFLQFSLESFTGKSHCMRITGRDLSLIVLQTLKVHSGSSKHKESLLKIQRLLLRTSPSERF